MKYSEPVVVVKESQLNQALEALNYLKEIGQYHLFKCKKCGAICCRGYVCPRCDNDTGDVEPVYLGVDILDRY